MTFFKKNKTRSTPIEIDRSTVSSNSPEIRQRLDRIEQNYQRLDLMLADVELKIQSDERLHAIDQTITEIEVEINGRKRKWRSRRSTTPKARSKSARPRKPR